MKEEREKKIDRDLEDRAFRADNLFSYLALALIVFINIFRNIDSSQLFFILFIGLGARYFIYYRETRLGSDLLKTILALALGLLSLVNYIGVI